MERKTPAINQQIKKLADELLNKYHPGDDWSLVPIRTGVRGSHFRKYLRQQLVGDLLLADGESLSAQTPEWYERNPGSEGAYYEPNLDMFTNTAPTNVVGSTDILVWGKGWDFKETGNWQRQIDIRFLHKNSENDNEARETLSIEVFANTKPYLFRRIAGSGYNEQGYEGHKFKGRTIGKKQARAFLDAVRFLEQFSVHTDIEPLSRDNPGVIKDDLDPKFWG